ncbi:MAG: OmpA family protein [Bacteroidia bacterium]|nr:OmpA family protein [Bacteroidia bacterium]
MRNFGSCRAWVFGAILVALLGGVAPAALAQRGKRPDLPALIAEADQLFAQRAFTKAETVYREALRASPKNYYLLVQLAHCNYYLNRPDQAVKWYDLALNLEPTRRDTTWFEYGLEQKKIGDYEGSTQSFTRFLELHKRNDYLLRQAKVELEGIEFAIKELRNPARYALDPIGVVGKGGDSDPAIFNTSSGRFLIFSSNRAGNLGPEDGSAETGEKSLSDLWAAVMENDSTFGKPEHLGKLINTENEDGSACISPDNTTLYFSIIGGGRIAKELGASIYQSAWDAEKRAWGPYEKVEGVNGSRTREVPERGKTRTEATFDIQPFITPDGNTMYFASDRDGGQGGLDLWYATRAGNVWSTPVNCGPEVNTEFNEIQPYISATGELIFASNGHTGMGGFDLYRSRGALNTWSTPENLGSPLNSSFDETTLLWLQTDSTALITSNRPGGAGSDDIYYVRKLPPVVLQITIQGTVRDRTTRQIIPFATVTLYQATSGRETAIDTYRTDQNGRYQFTLQPEADYKLIATAPEYLQNEATASTRGITQSKRLERDIDIFLERIELSRPVVLQNIYFDFDKSDLRPESTVELDRLAELMLTNPGITVQIDGHTDTNGSEQYNRGLSDRRAKVAVDYLIERGVSARRIRSFGFGESQPLVYPELSDDDEQLNRRTEFRILTLDFVPASTP